jgi:hypothetical protein
MPELLSFPNPVNEKAARVVAAGVVLLAAATLVTSWYWLLIPLAYGFVARVLTGPTLSPLGRFATTVIAPRLGPPKPVPGPPKRFAQGMGAAMTLAAAVAGLGFGEHAVADGLLAAVILAAALEAGLAVCLGCHVFAALIRFGIIPEAVCADCADIGSSRSSRSDPARVGSL